MFGLRLPNFRCDFALVTGVDRALFDFDKDVGGIGAGGYLNA